jgi:hypothetical protein
VAWLKQRRWPARGRRGRNIPAPTFILKLSGGSNWRWIASHSAMASGSASSMPPCSSFCSTLLQPGGGAGWAGAGEPSSADGCVLAGQGQGLVTRLLRHGGARESQPRAADPQPRLAQDSPSLPAPVPMRGATHPVPCLSKTLSNPSTLQTVSSPPQSHTRPTASATHSCCACLPASASQQHLLGLMLAPGPRQPPSARSLAWSRSPTALANA